MFIIISCVLVILVAIYFKHETSERTRALNKFPGPIPLPFIGNVLELPRTPDLLFELALKCTKKYSTCRFWIFMKPMVAIVSADDAEYFFTHTKNLEKTLIYDFLNPWLGTGIVTSKGDLKWKKRRKMLTPAFHFSILRVFFETMVEHSEDLVKRLQCECGKEKTDLEPIIDDIALQIICETAMGTTLNLEDTKHRAYMDAAYKMCAHMIYRITSPWYYSDTIFSFSSVARKMKKCLKILDDFTDRVIKEREKTFTDFEINVDDKVYEMEEDVPKKKRHVMLDLLIKEKRNGNIDDVGIREEVNTFMFAGQDTSATTITFALLLIANHQEIQDKIFKEIQEALGNRRITYNDLQNMPYLEMCIKESMRYYPAVPLIGRRIHEDLQVGDKIVPKDTDVFGFIYGIHHDAKHWPDPGVFDPERFLPENIKDRHPFAFVPFSAGPRNCIGQKFGMLEVKCVIASILRDYQIEPVTKIEDMKLMLHIVLKNNGPIFVKFKKR